MEMLCNFRDWGSGGSPVAVGRRDLPALPAHFVSRERLVAKVCAAARHRLTLVTGVPGAGKSALLADWAGGCGAGMAAWVGLQATDNDRVRFWGRVVAALQRFRTNACSGRALDALSLGESDAGVADTLVGELGPIGPAVIVLDDFHLLNDAGIIGAVGHLANHLPSNVHLVVASRKPPAFPVHQLRLDGELSEIVDRDLRLLPEEETALLSPAGGGRRDAELMAMVERCEGWLAGVRFAVLAAAGADPGRSASVVEGHRELVFEYLWHEVWAPLPHDVRQFLLDSSVLVDRSLPVDCSARHRLSPDLCAAVTGRADAGQVLASLARDNQFVSHRDESGGGFRCHRLFADFLTRQLADEAPMRDGDARRRAAASLEKSGDIGAAVAQLVAAGADEEAFALAAGALVDQVGCGFGSGGQDAWLPAGLPETFFEADPFRLWVLTAVLLSAARPLEAAVWLHRLDRAAAGVADATWWRGQAERLWAVHDGLVGDAGGVLRHSRLAAAALATTGDHARSGWWDAMDATLADQVTLTTARAHLWQGDAETAGRVLDSGPAAPAPTADPSRLGLLAIVAAEEGRLRDAYWLAHQALAEAEQRGRAPQAGTAEARLALGVVHWQWGDLDAAECHVQAALGEEGWRARPWTTWAVELQRLRTLLSRRRPDDVLYRVGRLRQSALRRPLPRHLVVGLDEVEIDCRLAVGDLDGANRVLKAMPPASRSPLLSARVDLCAGRPDRAVGHLTAAPVRRLGVGAEVDRLILLARAELQLGNRRRADDATRRALDRGRPEHFVRPFVDQAPELVDLVNDAAGRFPDIYLMELLARADDVEALPRAGPPAHSLEPLTGREREVLGQLTGHLSQHEIASTMYVSVNTVKSHVKRVYRKLGAGSRSEAVALARAHGLL
jgi:LuxR family maltose regulon positive regulatory protein